MAKYFCDICGKKMGLKDKAYAWSIQTHGEGIAIKYIFGETYNCVCNDCKNKIFAYVRDLQNSSNEGETNG